MPVYIEEADTLCHRALQDKNELVAAGVSRELIEDLPQRLGALIEAEKKWQKELNFAWHLFFHYTGKRNDAEVYKLVDKG